MTFGELSPAVQNHSPKSPVHSQERARGPAITEARLANGLDVVVIEDHRAPVVTHMIWYRNGSADDPPGKSGIAHFLEHLMFKGTKNNPQGKFSELIAGLGGQENAFTSNDYTAYFQRVAKQHLGVCMDYESDRMRNLVLTDEVVGPERNVVLEERRMRTESDPSEQLSEAVQAALFTQHPYGRPIIGFAHEIEALGLADAFAYYHRFYSPNNAILVIAGDVDPNGALRLVNNYYGSITPREEPPKRFRPHEPVPRAHRLVTLADEKVEQPLYQSVFLVPSYRSAQPGGAEAMEVLAYLLGGGHANLLFKTLVIDRKLALSTGAHYQGTAVDDTRFYVFAVPSPGISLETLDSAVGEVIAGVAAHGAEGADLQRAKTRLVAETIYAQDNQAALARWYGASLATGLGVDDLIQWPERIESVTAEAVRKAAIGLDMRRCVTGFLLPAKVGPGPVGAGPSDAAVH